MWRRPMAAARPACPGTGMGCWWLTWTWTCAGRWVLAWTAGGWCGGCWRLTWTGPCAGQGGGGRLGMWACEMCCQVCVGRIIGEPGARSGPAPACLHWLRPFQTYILRCNQRQWRSLQLCHVGCSAARITSRNREPLGAVTATGAVISFVFLNPAALRTHADQGQVGLPDDGTVRHVRGAAAPLLWAGVCAAARARPCRSRCVQQPPRRGLICRYCRKQFFVPWLATRRPLPSAAILLTPGAGLVPLIALNQLRDSPAGMGVMLTCTL